MFLKIIMILLMTLSFHGVYAQEINNQQNVKTFFNKLELLKRPLSLSQIAFCAIALVGFIYYFKKFFIKQKEQQDTTNQGNLKSPIERPTTPIQIIIKPEPKEKLLDQKISFEVKKVKYTGRVIAITDSCDNQNRIIKTAQEVIKVSLNPEIKHERTYWIDCEDAPTSFSLENKHLAKNCKLIPEIHTNNQQKFSLLPSCTLL